MPCTLLSTLHIQCPQLELGQTVLSNFSNHTAHGLQTWDSELNFSACKGHACSEPYAKLEQNTELA